ncbi:Unconventional myosin [Seminavis robusta]|uniref:Unconventional myosin n=1 Tax=Seminavis robusta TaxID=568900 RepID=A0A9N8EPC7_9STRA|nr:Unconventional myosin [Seminavis robusta]|eukprot:Sro1365_g266600.1 Unconventional myosin (1125) ;mRNA; r:25610-29246
MLGIRRLSRKRKRERRPSRYTLYSDEQAICSDGGRGAKKSEQRVVDLKNYTAQVLPLQNVDANGDLIVFQDMVELPYLHEAGILYNLKVRHMKGKPYTRTGDIIIAINPFQWFTEIYTDKVRTLYSNKLVWTDSGETDPRASLEPHVYETSSLCYKGLAFEGVDQSILVSGESGAGKTETVKIAMNHMASVQRGPVSESGNDSFEDPVVNRVLQSNPLLETFGNAKTTRNDNSSRFGKYTQLQFDVNDRNTNMVDLSKSTCKLAGSICEAYLLEKNRVTGHTEPERTYHIFYQILAAPEDQKASFWSGLKGTNFDSFKYVGNTATTKIEKRTDAEWFEGTCETLSLINLGGDKLTALMRAITATMQCGNLAFGPQAGDADKSECTSKKELADLADIIGVAEAEIQLAFTERTMKTRNETYKVPMNADSAKAGCDAFAKEVYGKLFLWLVAGINEATKAENNYPIPCSEYGIIGLLDIFGFESFVINRFEQLCINYANEKLQQKFTEDIFRSVQAEYEAEGIELAEITFDDNTDVLDLIEGRTGLCAMLNEECVRPKGSDEAFVQKALGANKKSPCLIVNNMDRMGFGIHHYAGKVMYSALYFVERNQDTLPTDLEEAMFKSSNFIIAYKVPEAPAAAGKAPKRQKSNIVGSTIWAKYKTQLSSLMTNLRKTRSRYIRCIKPNKAKVPVKMEHIGTVEQLRCAGVVAAVTITRSAFPNRMENAVARMRYNTMWDKKKYPTTRTDDDPLDVGLGKDCDALFTCALIEKQEGDKKAFVVGKTRTYFRAGALEYLEANRAAGMDGQAKQIQALVRGHLARKKFGNLRGAKDAEEKAKREAEERKKREAEEAKNKAERDKLAAERAEAARKKAEAEKKAREEAEKKAEAERKKREKEEAEAKAREEKEREKEVKKAQKEVEKLKKDLEAKEKENAKKVAKAEEKAKAAEKERDSYQEKYEQLMGEAAKIDKTELQAMQKKVAESDKVVSYLKKDNEKTRQKTKDMEADIEELKETNQRLVEASASAGASLDSLNKQKARIEDHNAKLEDNLGKYTDQNKQLQRDLDNRQAYFEAEKKIKEDYEKAMEKVVEMMEDKCDDSALVEKIMTAQLTCTTNNLNRLAGGAFPGL